MNREQRKTQKKKLIAQGISLEQANRLIKLASKPPLNAGDKVMLDIEIIESDVNYSKMNPKRKQFIQDNTNTVFTIEYELRYKEEKKIVCLKEDTADPKWLWWVGELNKVN